MGTIKEDEVKLNPNELQRSYTLDTFLILALLCGAAYLGGCAKEHDLKKVNTDISLRLVGIDGCEYIEVQSMSKWDTDVHVTSYTHKGNCNNPVHVYNRVNSNVTNGVSTGILSPYIPKQ